MRGNHSLGALGEAYAAHYLRKQGYRIIASNLRIAGIEIDLIVKKGQTLAFVEVKTRHGERFGKPEYAVDRRKQSRLIQGAMAWLHQQVRKPKRIRFDVIAIQVSDSDNWQLRHLPGAFCANPD